MIRQNLRSRDVIFTAEDEAAFCDLLLAREPNTRFVRTVNVGESLDQMPAFTGVEHIRDVGANRADIFFPGPNWKPQWELTRLKSGWTLTSESYTWPNGYWWGLKPQKPDHPLKLPDGRIVHCVGSGTIVFRARASHPVELRRVDALLRLVSKVATRKGLQRFEITAPEKPPHIFEKGRLYWAGHHAIAWARQSPDRYLACQILGDGRVLGWRPLD